MKKRFLMILCLITALALTLVGCGTGSANTGYAAGDTSSASEAADTAVSGSDAGETSSDGQATADIYETYPDAHVLQLSSEKNADGSWTHSATLDGETVEEFDYVWGADPSNDYGQVKNSPAEYYTGTEPDTDAAAYIAHDVAYFPELDESSFIKVTYDDDQEWAYYYTAEGYEEYIFALLPVLGNSLPTQMMHSAEDAYQNAVLYITEPGTYILEGSWHGQINIDLGDEDETFADESAKVTIVLNGVDVTCDVAPAFIASSAYECDNTWEDAETHSAAVDTSDAGVTVVVADGTVNNFTGANVYRMLKAAYKSGDAASAQSVALQKKARKIDAAFYSFVSMNINGGEEGTGVLNITGSTFEGLDTELHLTINGGFVHVASADDGINVNEDGVSVLTINGGTVRILGGLGAEGDGVDSNGYIVINGGDVISIASPMSDSGMDSDCGTYVNGGAVVALGSTMDWAEASDDTSEGQATMNLRFSSYQSADESIVITDLDGNEVFRFDPASDSFVAGNARSYSGAVVSGPNLKVGESYYVYVGGVQQGYSQTGSFGGFGGGRPGGFGQGGPDTTSGGAIGQPPEGGLEQNGTRPTPPEGGFGQGQRPEGFSGERPEHPDGEGFGHGGFGGGLPGGFGGQDSGSAVNGVFAMESIVNSFSGVGDLTKE